MGLRFLCRSSSGLVVDSVEEVRWEEVVEVEVVREVWDVVEEIVG